MAAASRLGPDDWARARALWEADATMTQSDLARMIGTTKQAVQHRAKKDGWQKVSNQGDLARRAYDKADAAILSKSADDESARALPAPAESSAPLDQQGGVAATLHATVSATAVELRAKVIERHRKEWDGARNHIYRAIQQADFDKAKLGKITAEALKIVQDGERKAWGLDQDSPKGEVVVTVKREES